MQKTIDQFSDIELKAAAYDWISKGEFAQKNLQVFNDEIAKRANEARVQAQKVAKEVLDAKVEEKTDDTNKEPEVSA